MPFIKQEKRDFYENTINELVGKLKYEGCDEEINTEIDPGDFSYVVYKMMKLLSEPEGYQNYSRLKADVRTAVEEFDRNQVVPYEEQKKRENGDI